MSQKKGMKIKGKYKDVLTKNGKVIKDFGWKSNTIVQDYGRFLAALMKKEFQPPIGIEYIAVGDSGTENDPDAFRTLLVEYFDWLNQGNTGPLIQNNHWVWIKQIEAGNMKYLDENDNEVPENQDTITNKLKIEVIINKNEPSSDTFDFKEFALLGIAKNQDDTFNTQRLFLINHVSHGQITKDNTMELTRTIKLTFPINEEKKGG